MRHFWKEAGLTDVSTRTIDVFTVFTDFEDLWSPFPAGQGPAPTNRQFNECWNGYFFFDFPLPTPTEQKIEIRTNPNNTIDEVVGIVFGEISPSYDILSSTARLSHEASAAL